MDWETSQRANFGDHFLDLKCHIVENMRYDIILGRDTLDKLVDSIDIKGSTITFKAMEKGVDTNPAEGETPC